MTGPTGAADSPVAVWVYADFGCPYSYVAWARLERLADERPLRLSWRPLQVRPGLPPEGVRLTRPGAAPGESRERLEALASAAEALGLPFRPPPLLPNTRLALEAAEFARDLGPVAFRALHRELFAAYFGAGADLGDRATLLLLAEEQGIDREGLDAALEDHRYEEELLRAEREAARYGIEGTPTILFGRFKVVGAAPLEELRRAAARAREEAGSEAGRRG